MLKRPAKIFTFLMVAAAICMARPAGAQSAVAPSQQEAERLYRESVIESRNNGLYSDAMDECRRQIAADEFEKAVGSCTRAVDLSQKLEPERILERAGANTRLGIAYFRQHKIQDALESFEQARLIASEKLTDADSEMGEIYLLIGQAHHLGGNIGPARAYYEKAESTFRKAIEELGDDSFFLRSNSERLREVVEAHYLLVRTAGYESAAEEMQKRLMEVERDFGEYLTAPR